MSGACSCSNWIMGPVDSGQPILLAVYGPDGEVVSVSLSPVRALELAKELIEPAVRAIKVEQWGPGWPG